MAMEEREVNLPPPLDKKQLKPPLAAVTGGERGQASALPTSSSSSSDFFRHAQAALKRQKTLGGLGMLMSNTGRSRRVLIGQTESSNSAGRDPCADGSASDKQFQNRRSEMDLYPACSLQGSEKLQNVMSRHDNLEQISAGKEIFEQGKRMVEAKVPPDTLLTLPSTMEATTGQQENFCPFGSQRDYLNGSEKAPTGAYDQGQPSQPISTDAPKKVHFSVSSNTSTGDNGELSKERAENKQNIGFGPSFDYMRGILRANDLLMSTSEDRHSSVSSACLGAPQRADERMATDTGMENLSSYMNSLALTEDGGSNQFGSSTSNDQDSKKQGFQHAGMGGAVCSEEMSDPVGMRSVGSGLFAKRNACIQDKSFMSSLGKEAVNPMTQSSVAGSTHASSAFLHPTATSVQCTSAAPMPNSTTYNSRSQTEVEPFEEFNIANPQPVILSSSAFHNQGNMALPSGPTFQCTSAALAGQSAVSVQASCASALATSSVIQNSFQRESAGLAGGHVDHAEALQLNYQPKKGKESLYHHNGGNDSYVQSQPPQTKPPPSNATLEASQLSNSEKAISSRGSSVHRKKHYDPDAFFKVNGKLYQKLGKIGSGGSSEVHKVITSDCTIYALKKIKLKGRDFSTAYGFCQEIEYLNRLRGKSNIIQLIDYEVTDKTLLEEVMNGSMTIKDCKIKDDGYIYMVLEYGEIDLAHMLSQKWKEMGSSTSQIDDNWLRFYWQQILQAVNTIHEERIVHSDLKPANFLLVKGSLKLIDFGIAKAIMSDTTNIQRDSQVGTLNYMSPESFIWDEQDANGNTIKFGRPSDIWSLGCILYQMVYGRTPFAEYKTFWTKLKVITDRNHQISYGPVSNPWLLDLMKKCLAWDRNERWRIPQLLQHPFLVPPVSPSSKDQQTHCNLLEQICQEYGDVPQVYTLCSQLQQVLANLDRSKQASMPSC